MGPIKIYALLLGISCGAIITATYLIPAPKESDELETEGLTEREIRFVESFGEVLYGGAPVNPGELIPSVNIGNCTGTVVSENVLITAGHCRSTNSSISFSLKGQRHTGRCVRHPNYSQGGWLNNDFALCKFSPNASLDAYGDLAPLTMKVGDMVTLQGYGAGSGGKLHAGNGVIARITHMDLVTSGRLALGGGDSGGALFNYMKDRKAGPFLIVGINSRGGRGTSLFNITSLERSQKFFKDYAAKYGVDICGVTKDCYSDEITDGKCHAELGILKDLESDFFFAKNQKDKCLGRETSQRDLVLINGELADPKDWPETVKISIGNSSCTATLVGPEVILSAAHCGSHRSKVRFNLNGKTHTGTCFRHPSYPRQDVDLLACKLDSPILDVRYASVSTTHAVRDIVTIAGYGCTKPGGKGADGKLRYGNARIQRYSAYDIVSSEGAALCFGDSGGPMFQKIVEPGIDPHYIIGVNSKGNIRDTSYNTRLDIKTSQDFLKAFEKEHSVQICGVSGECNIGMPLYCGTEILIQNSLQKKIDEVKILIDECEK